MTKLSKRSKFLIIVFSLIVSAKLKAHIDSATIAGIAFCATAILSFAALKKFAKK